MKRGLEHLAAGDSHVWATGRMFCFELKEIRVEKFAIEIQTVIGWVNYHVILRPGKERATAILAELKEKHPQAKFRVIRWTGEAVPE